jgi:hypothetical protein
MTVPDFSLWANCFYHSPDKVKSGKCIYCRRWVDNIKMDLGEVGWGDVDWIDLAKDRR